MDLNKMSFAELLDLEHATEVQCNKLREKKLALRDEQLKCQQLISKIVNIMNARRKLSNLNEDEIAALSQEIGASGVKSEEAVNSPA